MQPKTNNWTSSPKEGSPINDMKKQPEKAFKRISIKNDKKLKLEDGSRNNTLEAEDKVKTIELGRMDIELERREKKELSKQEDQGEMEKSEEQLIEKLKEDDGRDLN